MDILQIEIPCKNGLWLNSTDNKSYRQELITHVKTR